MPRVKFNNDAIDSARYDDYNARKGITEPGLTMARPDTDDGFVMVALDLFAALFGPGLTDEQRVVMAVAMLQAYGPPKLRWFDLEPPELERASGLHRNCIRRGIRACVAEGYLEEQDGRYRIIKDWEAHQPKGCPREDRTARFSRWALAKFAVKKRRRTEGDTSKESTKDPSARAHPLSETGKRQRSPITENRQAPALGPDVDANGSTIGGARAHTPEDSRLKIGDKTAAAAASDPPAPDHWESLCRLASRLPGLGTGFADLMRKAWHHNGAVQGWWEQYPDPKVWDAALRDYAGQDRTERPTVKGFVSYAKNAGLRARSEAAKAPKPTAKPTPAQAIAHNAAVARQHQHEQERRAEEEAIKARWAALPAAVRSEIEATIKREKPQQARIPAVFRALCYEAMHQGQKGGER